MAREAAVSATAYRGPAIGAPSFVSDVTYSGSLKVDIWKPAIANRPTIIFLHGGAWATGSKTTAPYPEIAWRFAELGFAVFNANYTLGSGAPATPITDVKNLVAWVRTNAATYNADSTRVAIVGLSAGAHLGMMAGIQGTTGTSRPDAVVGWSTPADLEEAYSQGNGPATLGVGGYIGMALTGNEATYRLYSPVDQITSACPPLRLVASDNESTGLGHGGLAVVQTTSLETAAENVGVEVATRIFESGVHSFFSKYIPSSLAALLEYTDGVSDDVGGTCQWLNQTLGQERPAFSRTAASSRAVAVGRESTSLAGIITDPEAPAIAEPVYTQFWTHANTAALLLDPDVEVNVSDESGSDDGAVTIENPGDVPLGGQCLRATFFPRTVGDGGGESTVGADLVDVLDELREAHVLTWIRFSDGWETDFGQGDQADHKTMFFTHNTEADEDDHKRWEIKFGWGTSIRIQIETAQEDNDLIARVDPPCSTTDQSGTEVQSSFFFTGGWHSIFARVKHSSAPDVEDGAYQVWIDGELVFDAVDIDTGLVLAGGFTGFVLGRNLNQIPTQMQYCDRGPIIVWDRDPTA